MRAPLLAVIFVYTVAITGLVLIPGVDGDGRPQPMDFLHAFYVVSYTATTIGFGEIPHAFTPAQRLWISFCIYLTVVAWSFAFVKLVALFQDRWFLQAIAELRLKTRVRRMAEPFYLVCGYGETGSLLCHALDGMGRRFVVLDKDEARLAELDMADYRSDAPALAADAGNPEILKFGGLLHRHCIAVLALTGNDRVNVAVAASARLLRPDLPVISRVESSSAASELRLFGAQRIINPHWTFADYLALAIRSPGSYQLMVWLTGLPGTTLGPQSEPPRGPWLVHGEGRFAVQVAEKLQECGLEAHAVSQDADHPCSATGLEDPAAAPWAGGLSTAAGLIAGTEDDCRNLSIVAGARAQRDGMFVVLRQNHRVNQVLFDAFASDITVFAPEIVVHECLAQLNTPLLPRFLEIVKERDDAWADAIVAKLRSKVTRQVPSVWTVDLTRRAAPAPCDRMQGSARGLRIDHLVRNPSDRDQHLPCVPLLIDRSGVDVVMPPLESPLQPGDRILFAGTRESCDRQQLLLQNLNALEYVCEGRNVPVAWVWRKLAMRGGEASRGGANSGEG